MFKIESLPLFACAGLRLSRDEKGAVHAEEVDEERSGQLYGSYKAERLLHFSATAFALAGWGELKAFTEFVECLLEAFWAAPHDGFMGPSVDDLKRCETAALKQAVRTMLATGCPMEDALHTVATNQQSETLHETSESCLCNMFLSGNKGKVRAS